MTTSFGDVQIIFGDPRQPKALPLSHPKARFGEFGTLTKVLPKGHRVKSDSLPLPCDILFERDIPVKLRDGTQIYVDVYRPHNSPTTCPALVAWSPYGKQGGRGNQVLDDFPFRMGVPQHKLSELQKWEGPDPGYWVQHGYAIVNPDPRGVGKSSGNIYQFGSQEGRDGADVVDWIGEQEWCSGKVGLSGNSYLAISQWYIAAERPKHLAAIAPWEGFTDLYKEGNRGGVESVPASNFTLKLLQVNFGEQSWENTVAMGLEHKIHGPYHDDKKARVENINVPAYVVASWSNPIHTYGTFCGYHRLKTDKWLRIHDAWEWPDYYEDENIADLHRFFDRFLKGLDNGWEQTPRCRYKVLDTAMPTPKRISYSESNSFPIESTKPLKLFLNGKSHKLDAVKPAPHQRQYAASTEHVRFTYTFESDTILCGPLELFLKVSVTGNDDSDIFVACAKICPSGTARKQLVVPYEKWYQSRVIRGAYNLGLAPDAGALFYAGPTGQLRLSRRQQMPDHQVPGFPTFRMDKYAPLPPNQVVPIQIPMTPIGMRFSRGETLEIRVSGTNSAVFPPVDQATLDVQGLTDVNEHAVITLHLGEESHVSLPVIPSASLG
ncbi:hypothetical protein PFICI_04324 [Pestalotiopsis fici W106-1]|uniref:Xaa-Pro dipeptidyl-peptidase C-terminal domain-containing protein n=1 Tax=Pestalotiopsis fici (strain W106-1 / CGMCC3.15140) TaxID=1229662 RepID=W3X8K0_PESFW|nr:uncharacterized protein PFICI_04324 [Pestalotiopsis fici W106-1]ETS82448.1 hypothetical protein PFICI_04324 [Pestalotiopsis fici W106-1]